MWSVIYIGGCFWEAGMQFFSFRDIRISFRKKFCINLKNSTIGHTICLRLGDDIAVL